MSNIHLNIMHNCEDFYLLVQSAISTFLKWVFLIKKEIGRVLPFAKWGTHIGWWDYAQPWVVQWKHEFRARADQESCLFPFKYASLSPYTESLPILGGTVLLTICEMGLRLRSRGKREIFVIILRIKVKTIYY